MRSYTTLLSTVNCLFSNINALQGIVWQHNAKSGEIFNNQLAVNLPRNLPVNFFGKSSNIWQKYGDEFVASLFGPPCISLSPLRSCAVLTHSILTRYFHILWYRPHDRTWPLKNAMDHRRSSAQNYSLKRQTRQNRQYCVHLCVSAAPAFPEYRTILS